MELNTDVAIIGAGPAGSALASLLAGRGVSVALIDRDVFPRDKLCGEFVSYDALPILERLGVIDEIERHGAPRIEHCRVVGSQRTYEFSFPEPARGVSRLLLDDLLFRTAVARGATPYGGWTATRFVPHAFLIELSKEDETRFISARVIVGAWGRWGRFDSHLGRRFVRDHSHRNFGFKRHYRSEVGERDVIELYSFARGYVGVSGVEGGLANICGLVHAARLERHKGRWPSFVEQIRREEPHVDRLYARHVPVQDDFLSSDPVIFRPRLPVEQGIFMIGDASGIVDPLAGDGIAMALQSALVAAPHLLRLMSNRNERDGIEREYLHRHAEMFGRRIRWSRTVARFLTHPTLVDGALATVKNGRVGPFLLERTRASREQIARLTDEWFSC